MKSLLTAFKNKDDIIPLKKKEIDIFYNYRFYSSLHDI